MPVHADVQSVRGGCPTEYGLLRGGWLAMVRLVRKWHRGDGSGTAEDGIRYPNGPAPATAPNRSSGAPMFNWFSLDYVYYPVSGIMWLWYKLFGLILGPSNFFTWALSVMFLVFTLRAVLYRRS